MSGVNGDASPSSSAPTELRSEAARPTGASVPSGLSQFRPEQVKAFVAELEVPFAPLLIAWRVTNTARVNGQLRGQVIPYADQRAYTDRLNELFTPAGWTRKYSVHTSANFQRSQDEKLVSKVFVTCDLTIFGIGSHSATGEEWSDNENAGTAAEAQAFKRAASCFGLGRYLYYFSGVWMDLDDRKRPMTTPGLTGWATPEGWRQGLRPQSAVSKEPATRGGGAANRPPNAERDELVRQIEAMARTLGKGLYRGLLKTMARVWRAADIGDCATLERLLKRMQAADRGMQRLKAAVDEVGREPLLAILQAHGLRSLYHVDSLEMLHKIVLGLEAEVQSRKQDDF